LIDFSRAFLSPTLELRFYLSGRKGIISPVHRLNYGIGHKRRFSVLYQTPPNLPEPAVESICPASSKELAGLPFFDCGI
jgi:hypothetical protein